MTGGTPALSGFQASAQSSGAASGSARATDSSYPSGTQSFRSGLRSLLDSFGGDTSGHTETAENSREALTAAHPLLPAAAGKSLLASSTSTIAPTLNRTLPATIPVKSQQGSQTAPANTHSPDSTPAASTVRQAESAEASRVAETLSANSVADSGSAASSANLDKKTVTGEMKNEQGATAPDGAVTLYSLAQRGTAAASASKDSGEVARSADHDKKSITPEKKEKQVKATTDGSATLAALTQPGAIVPVEPSPAPTPKAKVAEVRKELSSSSDIPTSATGADVNVTALYASKSGLGGADADLSPVAENPASKVGESVGKAELHAEGKSETAQDSGATQAATAKQPVHTQTVEAGIAAKPLTGDALNLNADSGPSTAQSVNSVGSSASRVSALHTSADSVQTPAHELVQSTSQTQSQAAGTAAVPAIGDGTKPSIPTADTAASQASQTQTVSPATKKSASSSDGRVSAKETLRSTQGSSSTGTAQHETGLVSGHSGVAAQDGANAVITHDPAGAHGANQTVGNVAGESKSAVTSAAQQDTFTTLDSGMLPASSTWIHAGAQRAEAGYQDPTLGWVGVRADAGGGSIHAALVPGTTDAAQALGGHLAGLNAYLAEHHSQVETVTMAAPETGWTGGGMQQSGGQGMYQGSGQGSSQGNSFGSGESAPTISMAASPAVLSNTSGSAATVYAARSESGHISVVA